MWISRLLIELQSSSKNQKNPHSKLIWGRNTFQSSIYHRFPLKPDCVKIPPLKLSLLVIELQGSSKNLNNPHDQLVWDRNTFQSSIYHSFPLKQGCTLFLCHYIHNCERHSTRHISTNNAHAELTPNC